MDEQRAALLSDIDNWIAGARTLAGTLEANGKAMDEGRVMLEGFLRLHPILASHAPVDDLHRLLTAENA